MYLNLKACIYDDQLKLYNQMPDYLIYCLPNYNKYYIASIYFYSIKMN